MKTVLCAALLVVLSNAQVPEVRPQVVGRAVQEGQVTTVYLAPRFTTAIRMPDAVNSVVLGDPDSFTAEHSDKEPQMVFVKPVTTRAAQTNVLISTTRGISANLLLISRGEAAGIQPSVDFLVRYRPAGRFIVEPSAGAESASIAPTAPLNVGTERPISGQASRRTDARSAPPEAASIIPASYSSPPEIGPSKEPAAPERDKTSELDALLERQRRAPLPPLYGERPGIAPPGKQLLKAGVSEVIDQGREVVVLFSVVNVQDHAVELMPPQIQLAGKVKKGMRDNPAISTQRRLNFEMSVRNLMQSFQDRERVPKIQGLLNECMTFLDDALSIITGPYDNLLSIDEVIEKELILFVTLNVNKNTEPVRALGKMLLQNIQLVVGKRYESEDERKRKNKPLFSVVMDEFAPFGYQNFSQILNTARGTNTAFLFSMQSVPQLLKVGKGFKEDVTSAPNTKLLLRTQDEETAKFFIHASAEHSVTRRTQSLVRRQLFGWERFEKGEGASEREEREYRAQDERIKNLPLGQMEILMTDNTQGTLHQHLHVRPPQEVALPGFEWEVLPQLRHSRAAQQQGANLRFKNAELAETSPWGRRIGVRR